MVQLSNGPPNGPGTTVVTTVALPQAPAPVPIRHALPQSPLGRPAPQLPRSPVRQHQLPTTPLQRSLVQQQQQPSRLSPVQPPMRTSAMAVTTNGGQQCIMVNPGRGSHLSMLPQTPTPGLLPSAASMHQNLLPQNPSTLVPLPHRIHHQQQTPAAAPATTTILPPTLLNRQLFSRTGLTHHESDGYASKRNPSQLFTFLQQKIHCRHLRSRLEMGVDNTLPQPLPMTVTRTPTGRNVSSSHSGGRPSSRQQQRDRRSLPCQVVNDLWRDKLEFDIDNHLFTLAGLARP